MQHVVEPHNIKQKKSETNAYTEITKAGKTILLEVRVPVIFGGRGRVTIRRGHSNVLGYWQYSVS